MSGSVWEQRKWRIYKIYYCNNYRKTVKHNVSVRFFTSCGESESSKIVLKSTRKKKIIKIIIIIKRRITCITRVRRGKRKWSNRARIT